MLERSHHHSLQPAAARGWVVALVVLGIAGITAAAARAWGQPWGCACGQVGLWAGDIWSSHCSQHLLDPYSLTHVSHGLVLGAALLALGRRWRMPGGSPWIVGMALEGAWEVFENSPWVIDRYRQATISLEYSGDSVVNVLGDLASCALGIAVARRAGWRWTLGALVMSEVALLVTIRDNLVLNVVMLAWPIEAIKAWQAASQGP